MTETDPGSPDFEPGEAGTTGSRRKGVGEPVTPDERESLNIPPNAPDMAEAPPAGRDGTPTTDLGGPPSSRDGTPHLANGTDAGRADAGTGAGRTGADRTGRAGAAVAGTGAGVTGTAGVGGAGDDRPAAGVTGKESVRRDIENDRRELGDTVEALVHKTDVKGRVQETATQVGEDIRRVGAATAGTATEMVSRVREAAPEMVGRMKEAAPEVVGRVKEMTPVEIKDAAGKVSAEAGKRPVLAFATVAALALVVFRMLRRGRKK
ncbi:DUF3618 domain-containing protein [Streptosporangium roseum]|uniref:DUF3618 domain-containing protein n=1 Tax=Streptosporangium roseum (strain ATCC 12428 / DSM 43021 / JCM 3005 / KCTC 9067 / NCIMB 10171 / NRRL 2505 / NI 9100) TaxID=479432 RepID=D2B058_STRRD|nr:DUF3618 domain-containing protein [Streptosporangium roseum]ACZ89064.1 hypothetical protein Sros_6343 [Streptosporangium roseum DSM 43021]